MRSRIVLLLVSLLWPWSALPQTPGEIGGNVHPFHEDVICTQNMKLEQFVVTDVEVFVEIIGLPNVAKINALGLRIRRASGINNAFACVGQGYRTIVFDPKWAASAPADFYLVLSHEAGHIFCGHENLPQSPKVELEADRFGGASIRRFEIYHNRNFMGPVLAAATGRYPEQGSALYPSRSERLEALRMGYQHGSPCGNLAPVLQSGYTHGVR